MLLKDKCLKGEAKLRVKKHFVDCFSRICFLDAKLRFAHFFLGHVKIAKVLVDVRVGVK